MLTINIEKVTICNKKVLIGMDYGDYLLYCVSGAFFTGRVDNIIASMDGDIWVSDLPLIEKDWTMPSVLKILEADVENIAETNQIQVSFICMRCTDVTIGFAERWLSMCEDRDLISPGKDMADRGGSLIGKINLF